MEAIRELEKAALEIDATTRVQSQLITQIEILQRSQSTKNQGAEGSRAPLSPSLKAGTTYTESIQRPARFDLPSDDEQSENSAPTRIRRSLASRTLRRLFGSRSRKKVNNSERRWSLATWEPLTHHSQRKSPLTASRSS